MTSADSNCLNAFPTDEKYYYDIDHVTTVRRFNRITINNVITVGWNDEMQEILWIPSYLTEEEHRAYEEPFQQTPEPSHCF